MNSINDDSSCSSDDSDLAFANMDFEGVDFEDGKEENGNTESEPKGNQEVMKEEHEVGIAAANDNVKKISDMNPTVAADSALVEGLKSMKVEKGERGKAMVSKSATLSAELATVTFDKVAVSALGLDEEAKRAVEEEKYILLNDCYLGKGEGGDKTKGPSSRSENDSDVIQRIRECSELLSQGQYIQVLCGQSAKNLFACDRVNHKHAASVGQRIRHCVLTYCTTVAKCIEVELVAVAGLNIYMQSNYTGPSLHHDGVSRPGKEEITYETVQTVNPHPLFASQLKVSDIDNKATSKGDGEAVDDKQKEPPVDPSFHNAVLAELSVDGEWPCPVCKYPYFLLLARSILSALADPYRPDWTQYVSNITHDKVVIRKTESESSYEPPSELFVACSNNLACATIWCGRAIVAHSRLLQGDEPSMTLWKEAKSIFDACVEIYCNEAEIKERSLACRVFLEYGLAEHHFDRDKKGKQFFQQALEFSDLDIEVTGAEGRRTKYQQKATAQMIVRAKPTAAGGGIEDSVDKNKIISQEVKFEEDTILLERVKYVEEDDNTHFQLSLLQQTVLLALCLDVKNDNPMDGLTGEQMGAYLERVLQQHDDWMVYASGLLERAWLESEKNHTRERALLQLQALADQHTNKLTFTQSTFQAAVEDSAPPQERLRNIHYIVYPPRWGVLRDLAERYAKIGIVTSAAEMFEEIELWDEVVECYRRAGKEKKAEEIVRKRLAKAETPRMWAALGDITGDKSHYENALKVSNGKFSPAHVALGKYYADKGDLKNATEQFKMAVRIKPLSPHVWFRLGALSMRIRDWGTALQAFTEVVQQEPEEGDAWANVAAIHMHNKNPGEAYPALNEVCT